MTAETLRERLLGEVGKPICPYDRRHPDYWTTPDDAACKVCGQLPDGPDICKGADTNLFRQAAEALAAQDVRIQWLEEKAKEALGPFAALGRETKGCDDDLLATANGLNSPSVRRIHFRRAATFADLLAGGRGNG